MKLIKEKKFRRKLFFLPCVKLIKEKKIQEKTLFLIIFFSIFFFMRESGKKNRDQTFFTEQYFSFICETEWVFVYSQEKNLLFLVWNWLKKHFCFIMWKSERNFFTISQKKLFFFQYFFISVKMGKKTWIFLHGREKEMMWTWPSTEHLWRDTSLRSRWEQKALK